MTLSLRTRRRVALSPRINSPPILTPRCIINHPHSGPQYTTMSYTDATKAPHVFYRVEDASSRARYSRGHGIWAEDADTEVNFGWKDAVLRAQVARHLDWSDDHPSPFISMYSEKSSAQREAKRRLNAKQRNVRIYKIDMSKRNKRTEYRNIRRLAQALFCRIPYRAWNNSEHEYICYRHVPASAIVRTMDIVRDRE